MVWLRRSQIEALNNLDQLLFRVGRQHTVTVSDLFTPEQGSISGEQNPLLGNGDLDQGFVVAAPLTLTSPKGRGAEVIVLIGRIEAEQTQVAGQLAKMSIEDETNLSQWVWAQPNEWSDVERFEDRIDADPITIPHDVRETHRVTFHQNQIDFGGRHTERFDHFLDRKLMLENMS